MSTASELRGGSELRRAACKGWGETPLSVTWAWPSATLSYDERYEAMVAFCEFAARVICRSE